MVSTLQLRQTQRTVCCFLMERAGRRYREARDGGADPATMRYYTDVVNTLDNSFTRFESGTFNDNSVETRNALREFARFSPRADSPTAAMSMEEMADEIDMKTINVLLMMKKRYIDVATMLWKLMMEMKINLLICMWM